MPLGVLMLVRITAVINTATRVNNAFFITLLYLHHLI